MRSSFFPQRRKQDVCVPDRSIHSYQLTVIISDFPRFSNSASLSLSFCTSASRLLPYLFFLFTLLYLLCHIELYIQRNVFSCHPRLRQDWRIEQRRFWVYEGRRKMQTQGAGHCVKLDFFTLRMWTCGCLFIDKLLQLLHKIYIFKAFSLMRGVLFSILMPMPHVTKSNFLFVSALFLLQRLTIQRRRWKRKEGKRTYSFRFSSKSDDTLLNNFFCVLLLVMIYVCYIFHVEIQPGSRQHQYSVTVWQSDTF